MHVNRLEVCTRAVSSCAGCWSKCGWVVEKAGRASWKIVYFSSDLLPIYLLAQPVLSTTQPHLDQ